MLSQILYNVRKFLYGILLCQFMFGNVILGWSKIMDSMSSRIRFNNRIDQYLISIGWNVKGSQWFFFTKGEKFKKSLI